MSTGLLLQYLVIALAVLASAAYVLQKQWPGLVRRLRLAMAVPLVREHRPAWVRRLGYRLAPAPVGSGKAGCGGCDQDCEPGPGKRH